MASAKSFSGNPYDGHTLAAQLKQVDNLIGGQVSEAHVNMGYRDRDYEGAVTVREDKLQRGKSPRGGSPKHRTLEERTPAGAQPLEGRCRRCDPCHQESRDNELPEAPQSFLAHFSAPLVALLELDIASARAAHLPYAVCKC